MIKLVESCAVCGGRGKFLTLSCERCKGLGGKIVPFDERVWYYIEPYFSGLSAQEKALFDLYRQNLCQNEISRRLDISKNKVIFLLKQIQKRINQRNEEKN